MNNVKGWKNKFSLFQEKIESLPMDYLGSLEFWGFWGHRAPQVSTVHCIISFSPIIHFFYFLDIRFFLDHLYNKSPSLNDAEIESLNAVIKGLKL